MQRKSKEKGVRGREEKEGGMRRGLFTSFLPSIDSIRFGSARLNSGLARLLQIDLGSQRPLPCLSAQLGFRSSCCCPIVRSGALSSCYAGSEAPSPLRGSARALHARP